VLAELVERGHKVLLPFGVNHRYDLVIDDGGHFVRAQCKTGRLRRGCVIFHARSIRSNTRKAIDRPYHDEVDLFLVHCPQTERVYAVPVDETTTSDVALRVDPPANGQVKRIRWAADHELPA
jgi:PD-(D/E)XK nuclease superfamily protein